MQEDLDKNEDLNQGINHSCYGCAKIGFLITPHIILERAVPLQKMVLSQFSVDYAINERFR